MRPLLLLAALIFASVSVYAIPRQVRNTTAQTPLRPLPPFYVPNGATNIARYKPVTSSDDKPRVGTLSMITDGVKTYAEGSWVELGSGVQWVQIDLLQPSRIFGIHIWHYFWETRVYRDVVVRVSNDPDFVTGVTTVHNDDRDNSSGLGTGTDREFYASYQGCRVDTRGKNHQGVIGRYVRLYSRGNSFDPQNHYTEVEVIGKPLSAAPLTPPILEDRLKRGEIIRWKFPHLPGAYHSRWDYLPSARTKFKTPIIAQDPVMPRDFLVPAQSCDAAVYTGDFSVFTSGKWYPDAATSSSVKPLSGTTDQVVWRHNELKTAPKPRWVTLPRGLQWLQLDLHRPYYIHALRLWHFFEDKRTYHDVIVQIADDKKFTKNVRTLFNNDGDNSSRLGKGKNKEYAESENGLLIDARSKDLSGPSAQFVRFYSRGSNANTYNHYVSVEVIGSKAPRHPLGHPELIIWETDYPSQPYT